MNGVAWTGRLCVGENRAIVSDERSFEVEEEWYEAERREGRDLSGTRRLACPWNTRTHIMDIPTRTEN